MRGKILGVDGSTGAITGEAGARFQFDATSWKGSVPLRVGMDVDFVPLDGRATEIYPVGASSVAPGSKSKIAAGILGILLGGLGIHKFYLGYTGPGLVTLAIFVGGWLLLGIPSYIICLIAFVEGIIYLTKSDEEFQQIYVEGKRPWF
ncbi:MAG: NINE protein [Proteobacteria bacterium]|nr:NINE protein [Pseudomonadota bacterium]